MKKKIFIFIFFVLLLNLYGCNYNDESIKITPPRTDSSILSSVSKAETTSAVSKVEATSSVSNSTSKAQNTQTSKPTPIQNNTSKALDPLNEQRKIIENK